MSSRSRTTKAVRFHEIGEPEVLRWEDIELPSLGPSEALLRNTAIGVNMKEIGERKGEYPCPPLPTVPGIEAAAIVVEVGKDVTGVKPGDRVGYATMPTGSYAELRILPADRLIALPDDISDETAAAVLHKGMTARYLVRKTFPISGGEMILVHAAAGGTGTLLCQWAKHLGATVIGTVGSAAKADYARAHGCDHIIRYTEEDFVSRVRDITGGQGVAVVYDSVGKDTFYKSLECLDPLGMMVLYGIASGHPTPLELMKFDIWKSYFYTRPSFFVHTKKREDLLASADDVFDVIRKKGVQVNITKRVPLREASAAHRMVDSRATIGSVLLIP
jgi:NADPH:quinone reductase